MVQQALVAPGVGGGRCRCVTASPLPEHVDLAAENRLNLSGLTRLVVSYGAEHVAMIGHRHSRHPELFGVACQSTTADRAIEQRVLGVHVEVDELRHGPDVAVPVIVV